MKFLETEESERYERKAIFENLLGWNKHLFQKCNQNSIMDLHTVNQPLSVADEHAEPEPANWQNYVFAGFMEPGFHQIIIYDPLLEKAYCKEFLVDFRNLQEHYPEIPRAIADSDSDRSKLPNVFAKWIPLDREGDMQAFFHDTA